ncbi:MAG: enoyl-CoA hydratase [Chloroflexi bacterium]|nr:MAG: enoyl-CoA hydratase [Chloroflexota bacterium]
MIPAARSHPPRRMATASSKGYSARGARSIRMLAPYPFRRCFFHHVRRLDDSRRNPVHPVRDDDMGLPGVACRLAALPPGPRLRPAEEVAVDYEAILYDVSERVATITLNRPERMNAFSGPLLEEWEHALRRSAEDDGVRAVIVTGAGRAFSAGADLQATGADDRVLMADKNAGERRNSLRYTVHRVPQAVQYLDKPYIAAVNGAAVGAGMDMASMADIRIASDQARFGMSYVNVGLVPGDGGAWLLPRLVGVQQALELIWSGELFNAAKALEIGYVTKVVPHDTLMDEARAYALRLADGPPVAIQLAKRLVYRALNQTFQEALETAQAAMTIV